MGGLFYWVMSRVVNVALTRPREGGGTLSQRERGFQIYSRRRWYFDEGGTDAGGVEELRQR